MKIFTSIAPRRHEVQKKCIQSWVDNNFTPISVNTKNEIDNISTLYPDVTFIVAPGKSKIRINDLFSMLPDENVGIINADILLTVTPEKIAPLISQHNLVMANRVNTRDYKTGNLYRGGFDIFFMHGNNRHWLPNSIFKMGEPAWDYWLPYIFIKLGHEVVLVDARFAYHLVHGVAWSIKLHKQLCAELGRIFEPEAKVRVDLAVWRYIIAHAKKVTL